MRAIGDYNPGSSFDMPSMAMGGLAKGCRMRVVLVVEPELFSAQLLSERIGSAPIILDAATPVRAVLALQAVMFDTVVIALDKIDEAEYAMLVSAMRLISPASRLLCLPVA